MLKNDDPKIGTLLDRWITKEPPYEDDDNEYMPFGGNVITGVQTNV